MCCFVKWEAFCLFSTGCTRFLPSWLQHREGAQLEGKVFCSNSCAIKHWNKPISVVPWTVCVWHVVSERAQLRRAGELYSWVITCSWQMVQAYDKLDLWLPHSGEQTAWLSSEGLLWCWDCWWRNPLWQESSWSASLWVRNRMGLSLLSNRVWSTSLDQHSCSQSHLALAELWCCGDGNQQHFLPPGWGFSRDWSCLPGLQKCALQVQILWSQVALNTD